MPNEIINRDDIPEGSQIYWYSVKTKGGKKAGIPGDTWTKSWKIPQSMYSILAGPFSVPDENPYTGITFPSLSPYPNIALEEYKAWEIVNQPERVLDLIPEGKEETEEELPSTEEAISMIEEIETPPEEKKSPKGLMAIKRKPKREPGASEIISIK